MKALNQTERKKAGIKFISVFGLLLIVFSLCSFFTIQTGKKGISVLEKRHAGYTKIFEKQAAFSYEIDNIIKQLYQLKKKNRTLSQHRQFQGIISGLRDEINQEIADSEYEEQLAVYGEMLNQVKQIQAVLDKFEEDNEEYAYFNELLERCIEKYQEEARKQNRAL